MPDLPDLFANATEAYRAGRLEEAFRLSRDVLKAHPGNLDAMLLMGIIATKEHQFSVAIPLLGQVTERDPSSFLALLWLSIALRRVKKLSEALVLAEKALALNRQEPQALFELGMCHKELRNWESAEASLRSAAKVAPHISSFQYQLGLVLEQLGRSSDALVAYRRAVALNSSNVDALYCIGQIVAQDLDFRSAEEFACRILEVDSNSISGHSLMATACVGLNKPTEAADHVARALNLQPNQPDVLTHCAMILQAIGQLEEADTQLR